MAVVTKKKQSQGAFYAKVDKAFYDSYRDKDGNLPKDLLDKNGKPRKLNMSPKDRAFRKKWLKLRDQMRKSKAVPKKPVKGGCVECQLAAEAAKIGKIKLPKKENGAPKAVVPPPEPVPRAKKHKEQKETPCKHQTLTVACSHNSKRGFQLELPAKAGPDGEEPAAVIEVIDDGHELIACGTKVVGGPCPNHHRKVFDVTPYDTVDSGKTSDSRLEFGAQHDLTYSSSRLVDFINPTHEFPPVKYTVRSQTCQQEAPLSATVAVYPQVDWDGEIKIGRKDTRYEEREEKQPDWTADRYDDQAKLVINGNAWITVRGAKVAELKTELTGKLGSVLKASEMFFHAVEAVDKIMDTFGGVKIEFTPPMLSLAGNWGRKEIHGGAKTGLGGSLTFGFKPLIGGSIQVDVLTALLLMAEPVGPAIARVKKLADKAGVQIQIPFKVKGEIRGSFKYEKTEGEEHGRGSGEVGGRVTITLELLSIKFEKKFWGVVKVGTEARAGAHTMITGKVVCEADDHGPYCKGGIKLDGLMLYGVIAASGSVNFDAPPDDFEKRSKQQTDESDVTQPDYGGSISEGKADSMSMSGKVGYKFTHTFWRGLDIFKGDKHYLFSH